MFVLYSIFQVQILTMYFERDIYSKKQKAIPCLKYIAKIYILHYCTERKRLGVCWLVGVFFQSLLF